MPESIVDLNQQPANPPAGDPPAGTEPPAGTQPPAGDPPGGVPEWVHEKYRAAPNPVEAQARAYAEAVQRLTTKTDELKAELRPTIEAEIKAAAGVPDKPEGYKPPAGIEASDPLYASVVAKAHAAGLSQPQLEAMFDLYDELTSVDIEAEKGKLGAGADTRIQAVGAWGAANIPKELHAAAMKVMQTADGFRLIEALMKKAQPSGFLPNPDSVEPPVQYTREGLQKMMDDERFKKRDPSFMKEYNAYAEKLGAIRAAEIQRASL